MGSSWCPSCGSQAAYNVGASVKVCASCRGAVDRAKHRYDAERAVLEAVKAERIAGLALGAALRGMRSFERLTPEQCDLDDDYRAKRIALEQATDALIALEGKG